MKKTRIIIAVALVALAAFMAVGCKPMEDTRSAKECMEKFAAAVNAGQWGDLKDCTHSGADNYNTFSTSAWKLAFDNDTGVFTFTMNGDNAIAYKDGIAYNFYLKEDGTDKYAIYRISRVSNGSIVFE